MHFTGKIGDVIDISGSNFSRISRVLFSNAGSSFSVPNDNLIKARVPEGVAWDYIKIISDDRNATGISSKKFAPEPLIQDYYPISGIYGDTIYITGLAFSVQPIALAAATSASLKILILPFLLGLSILTI